MDDTYRNELWAEKARREDEPLTFDDIAALVKEREDDEVLRFRNGQINRRPVSTINLITERIKVAKCLDECGFLYDKRNANVDYMGKGPRETQYVQFKIPGSIFTPYTIRIGDHRALAINYMSTWHLCIYERGTDGVIEILREFARNLPLYSATFNGDLHDTIKDIEEALSLQKAA